MSHQITVERSASLGRIAVFAVSMSLVLNMAGYLSVAAVLPELIYRWRLTELEAGWLASCHIGVYAVAAVLLLPLTDYLNVRRIIIVSLFIGALGGLGFAWFADGFWSGIAFRSLVGVAQAGVYMPGLKLIADSVEDSRRSRATAIYSSMIPIGSAFSLWLPSAPFLMGDWRIMFMFTGIACLSGCVLMLLLVPAKPRKSSVKFLKNNPYVFLHVLNNIPVMRYVLCYSGHTWETFCFRAWIVTFLVFTATRPDTSGLWIPDLTSLAALIVVTAAPVSMLVGRWCAEHGFDQALRLIGLTSLGLSLVLAAFTDTHLYVVFTLAAVYGVVGFADQGALGSALIEASDPEARGSTLAVYTLFGFSFGMFGAVAGGAALEAFGGIHDPQAWQMLWITCGAGSLLTTLLLRSQRTAHST